MGARTGLQPQHAHYGRMERRGRRKAWRGGEQSAEEIAQTSVSTTTFSRFKCMTTFFLLLFVFYFIHYCLVFHITQFISFHKVQSRNMPFIPKKKKTFYGTAKINFNGFVLSPFFTNSLFPCSSNPRIQCKTRWVGGQR